MNVSITPAYEAFVRHKVEAGDFQSAEEVVNEGLRLLRQQDGQWAAEARAKIDEGWNQAKSDQLLSPQELHEGMEARKAAWRVAKKSA